MAQTLSSSERLPTVLYRTPHGGHHGGGGASCLTTNGTPLSAGATTHLQGRTSSFYPNNNTSFASPSSPILSPVGLSNNNSATTRAMGLRTPLTSKLATPYSEVERSGHGHGVGGGGDHHHHHSGGMSTGQGGGGQAATRHLYGNGSAPPPPITSLRETDRRGGGGKLDQQGKAKGGHGTEASSGPNPLLANEYAFGASHSNNPQADSLDNAGSGANNNFRSRWVTVYGFQQSDRDLILRELQECGDILSCRNGGTERANFMHIQFQSKGEAQKALSKNGKQISKNLIMGTAPISQKHCSSLLQTQTGAGGASVLSQASCPKQQALMGAPNGGIDAMPQPVNTFWSKVNEYIFGI